MKSQPNLAPASFEFAQAPGFGAAHPENSTVPKPLIEQDQHQFLAQRVQVITQYLRSLAPKTILLNGIWDQSP